MDLKYQSIYSVKNQISETKKRFEEYEGIKKLRSGSVEPGLMPEIVAIAIKQFIPIPLKYTHSYQGLKALYKHSIYVQDLHLYMWTRDQIKSVLPSLTLEIFNKEYPNISQFPVAQLDYHKTPRQLFLSSLKQPDINQLCIIQSKCPKDSFWEKQISRFVNVNSRVWKIQPSEINHFNSAFHILEFSNLNASKLSNTRLQTSDLIETLKINPSVYIPALIQSYAQKQEWNQLLANKYFGKKGILQKYPINIETLKEKLQLCNYPPEILSLFSNDSAETNH